MTETRGHSHEEIAFFSARLYNIMVRNGCTELKNRMNIIVNLLPNIYLSHTSTCRLALVTNICHWHKDMQEIM